jgi:hypothetical protein
LDPPRYYYDWELGSDMPTLRSTRILLTNNSTTPGFDIVIPRGAVGEIGFKDGHTYHKHMGSKVTWRAPQIEINNSKIYESVAFGPRLTLSTALPGMEKPSFGLGARSDLPKLELPLAKRQVLLPVRMREIRLRITNVNNFCQSRKAENGGIAHAFGLWVEIAAGFYANLVTPYGTTLDTNWLGKMLAPGFQGLMYSRMLGGICWDEESLSVLNIKWVTGQLNQRMKTMQHKAYTLETEKDWRMNGTDFRFETT